MNVVFIFFKNKNETYILSDITTQNNHYLFHLMVGNFFLQQQKQLLYD